MILISSSSKILGFFPYCLYMFQSVCEKSFIKDTRNSQELKNITLSNYKKIDVKNALIENLLREKVENALNWTAELICSGHFSDLWDAILFFFPKYIYLANPALPYYLKKRYEVFRSWMNNSVIDMELRNNEIIRKLFTEIICVLISSKKQNSFEHIKIDREEEFDMTKNNQRYKAPTMEYAVSVMKKDDPTELFISINEFLYSLSIKDNSLCRYWVDWIIEFDTICRSRKEPCYCEKREDLNVERKFKKDIVWLIWDSILHKSEGNDSHLIKKTISSLFDLFCIRYTNSLCKKRRYIIYYAISLLIEPVDFTVEIVQDKTMIDFYTSRIDDIYIQIKKSELSNGHCMNEKEKNFNKSMEKINLTLDFQENT